MYERYCDARGPLARRVCNLRESFGGLRSPHSLHTADGELIWISGTGRFTMKDVGDQTVKPGMFVSVPSKHHHSERCITACSFYAVGDQAFDIHYVDASGNEFRLSKR